MSGWTHNYPEFQVLSVRMPFTGDAYKIYYNICFCDDPCRRYDFVTCIASNQI